MKLIILIIVFILANINANAQNRFDIVIDEIMADPTPVVSLPNNEWIELKNVSASPVNLFNWRIGDASSQSGVLPNFLLQADSTVIICSSANFVAMSVFGQTLAVASFPSLDNDGEILYLKAANGKIIHAVNYSSSWYQNDLKKDGGWSLEMIDIHSPCAGIGNWKASINLSGGTPGKKNSVDAINTDRKDPVVKSVFCNDSLTIIIEFDEPVDSLSAASATNYIINNNVIVSNVAAIGPLFQQVQLKLSTALQTNFIYQLKIKNVHDCSNNVINETNCKIGLPVLPLNNDIVINEILFNPRANAYDFVEFYNNSKKIVDLSRLFVASKNVAGLVSSLKPISNRPLCIFPNEYIVITEDPGNLALQYLIKDDSRIITLNAMPSLPDDEGDIICYNSNGDRIDEVKYNKDWHFKLISDPEGVSLERMDLDAASNEKQNWHSAASTAGYATPGYQNSQYKKLQQVEGEINAIPKTFSPDNDGRDDQLTIQYLMPSPGYVANIKIYNYNGIPVRNLVQNNLLGLKGYWNWDGLDNSGKKLPFGPYIVYTEVFNLDGRKAFYKNVVVLARVLK